MSHEQPLRDATGFEAAVHLESGRLFAVACSWNLPIGTKLRITGDPTGRVYSCDDRGLLSDTWVDVFFFDPDNGWPWQASVGRCAAIEIVEARSH